MKRIAILQSNYIPWKGYFDIIAAVDEFYIYDCVQYTKNDWRNRNQIKSDHGKAWLTVPVRHHHLHQTIEQTEIADPRCFRKHWSTFRQNYARAPHLNHCADLLADIFLDDEPPTNLSKSNVRLIRRICDGLGIGTTIASASDMVLEGDRNQRLLMLCRQVGATAYVSGPSARTYLDEQLFSDAGISVEWMQYSGYTEYDQPFPPFDHHVSILDLLAMCGRNAGRHMLNVGSRPT